jgi:hypothetical protein
VEYGIVEHRLRTRFPDLFAAHVADQGHSMFGSRAYTASSVRFGVTLGRLERMGDLDQRRPTRPAHPLSPPNPADVANYATGGAVVIHYPVQNGTC